MNADLVEQVVNAVLYEGYILYPYRPSSTKNRHRFTFGRVYPESFSAARKGGEPCFMQTQCLVRARVPGAGAVEIGVRFLHPTLREVLAGSPEVAVPELIVDGHRYQTWQEAVERTVQLTPIGLTRRLEDSKEVKRFEFAESCEIEAIRDKTGARAGSLRRRRCALGGRVEVEVEPLAGAGVFKLTVRVLNTTPVSPAALTTDEAVVMHAFVSTHTILRARAAEFFSMLDPPPPFAAAAAACKNIGVWPVLVGDEEKAERDTLLASPIILYDYPRIASQSAGDLFDGAEIDEILTLRIKTLTDGERLEMRDADAQARRILERTESLSDRVLSGMHGTMQPGSGTDASAADAAAASGSNRDFFPDPFGTNRRQIESVRIAGRSVRAGDRVRIWPRNRADIMDLALEGQTAIVEAIEQDVDDRVHLALVIEDDPGRDLGMMRQPGHRFFYTLEEVEPLDGKEAARSEP